jgi:hypothetical protein
VAQLEGILLALLGHLFLSLFPVASISSGNPPSRLFLAWGIIISLLFTGSGGLWAFAPKLFGRVYRRVAIGDYNAKTPEWERETLSLGGRILGYLFFCGGLGVAYLLLRITKIL